MFSFKHLLNKAINTVTPSKDAVLFDNSTEYLYFDTEEGNDVVRHVVHAPSSAGAVDYSNTTSGLDATTAQGAIDELSSSLEDVVHADQSSQSVTPIDDPVIHFSDLDAMPTPNSTTAVTSGGIYSFISSQITEVLTTSY